MAKAHSDGLNTIGTTKALCPAKLQARQEQQSNKIPDQLATPEQVHGGQLVRSWMVILTSKCQTCQVRVSWVPEILHFDWLLRLKAMAENRKKPFIQWYQSREGCYHAAAIENMVPGVHSRLVNMCTASQELRSLSLGERM